MAGTHPPARHRINLLSIWREDEDGNAGSLKLRFRLEDPRPGGQQVYPNLEMLLTALEKILLDSLGDIEM